MVAITGGGELLLDKTKIHSWQPSLHLGKIRSYGPRNLTKLLDRHQYPEINEADRIYLVTNASALSSLLGALGKEVILINPATP